VKPGKTVLVALAIIVAFVYQILANAAPAYLTTFPWGVFWGAIVAPLTLATILIAILQNWYENKQHVSSTPQMPTNRSNESEAAQHLQTNQPIQQALPIQSFQAEKNAEHIISLNALHPKVVEEDQPTVEHPALLCLALDVF
jgi:hypothetical protein